MAKNVRVVMNPKGIEALLKSSEVQADLKGRADRIAANAGPGMEARVSVGRTRARAVVITGTEAARVAEATHRSLTSALDAGR